MPTLYVIPNWERDFENSRSKTLGTVSFFCVQNHFDGTRMRRLVKLKNCDALYGSFHAICAIASRCEYRGVLLNEHGPLGALEISDKTGFPVKGIERALTELSKTFVGLIEQHEIDEKNGKWVLPESVCRWAVHRSQRRPRADTRGHARTHDAADVRGGSGDTRVKSIKSAPQEPRTHADTGGHSQPHADARGQPQTLADTQRRARLPTEGNKQNRKILSLPSLSLQADKSIQKQTILISDTQEAKRLICEKILGGKNPGRLWSPDAENRLSEMCQKEGGIPLQEIEDIGWFRSLPASDDIPELKARRTVTETGLMNFWGDEARRAGEYRRKNHAENIRIPPAKPEPPQWREFLRWQYDEQVRIPPSFWDLPKDQQQEYEREFQTFVNKTTEGTTT